MNDTVYTVIWSFDTAADSPEDAARITAGVMATGNDPAAESRGNALLEVMDESGNAVGDFEVAVPSWAAPTVGTCPACGKDVHADEPDGPVWTCPADLAETNAYYEPCLYPELIEKWEREGYYGRCGEDVGLPCHESMPLHSACYERGNY